MNNIREIRRALGMTQAAFGSAIGVTQGNVSHYERGQDVPPDVARRVIAAAAAGGVSVTFDDIYAQKATA
jgi:putative transcriptional regulator